MTNTTNRKTLLALACSGLFLTACASAPIVDPSTTAARAKLTELQSDPNLSSRAPVSLNEADAAVRNAEAGFKDADAAAHAGYVAEQQVAIAEAEAQRRYLEDQRKDLSQKQNEVRLDARTAEAQRAERAAQMAKSEAEMAREEAERLKREIAELNAKPTDRGLVMTLGDVLFATGKSELLPGATANLDKLVTFLNEYEEKTVLIEGHTDSVGSESFNLTLSQQRADSVRAFLASRGIAAQRLTAVGKGKSTPVASNETSAGRQQNRRVEVVIQG